MPDGRVLVVGTTPDYIAYIDEVYPDRALFLTDSSQRRGSAFPPPTTGSEIICNLSVGASVRSALNDHLRVTGIRLSGITCYDCEWLSLAAELAAELGLPYPDRDAVRTARDKSATKLRWAASGVRCPQVGLVATADQAVDWYRRLGQPVVVKPLTGSGSELTFCCRTETELRRAVEEVLGGLARRSDLPMYRSEARSNATDGQSAGIVIEEFIDGDEYSADFIVEGEKTIIIRLARKLRDRTLPFGTTRAYVVPAELPDPGLMASLPQCLGEAARSLGFERAVAMVDFMIRDGDMDFLELTPRIGGDCLPPLVRECCGLDTIGLALDFAEQRPISLPEASEWQTAVGLRLFAAHAGILRKVDYSALADDSRVRSVYIKRSPGHSICLPPEDYDSWQIGHVVYVPDSSADCERQSEKLRTKIIIDVEKPHGQRLAQSADADGRVGEPTCPPA